jgi:hypothetical protein
VLEVQAAIWSQKLLQWLSRGGGRIVQNEELFKTTITWPRKRRDLLPEKPAHFLRPNMVEVKLIVQTQALAAGAYGRLWK